MSDKRQAKLAIRRTVRHPNGRMLSGRQWVKLRKTLLREARHAKP